MLYDIFKENLTERLALQLDGSFKSRFMDIIEQKEESVYLKGDALAIDIAEHCNLCEKLTFPLYFQDDLPRVKMDIGLNHFTDRMLEQCNDALNNHMFTVIGVEEPEKNRLKITYRMAHFHNENNCTMIPKYPEFVFNKQTLSILYYIKYILNEYDFYLQKREEYLKTQIKKSNGVIENVELLMDQIENPRMNYMYAFLQSDKISY